MRVVLQQPPARQQLQAASGTRAKPDPERRAELDLQGVLKTEDCASLARVEGPALQ